MRRRTLYVLAGALAAAALVATPALAGSGVNGVFNLGVTNSVNATTTLTGSTAGPQLKVTNSNGANQGITASSGGGAGVAIFGTHTTAGGGGPGVQGTSASTVVNAAGVLGKITSTGPNIGSAGVRGESAGTGDNGVGVLGVHTASTGSAPGVEGTTNSDSFAAAGVRGSTRSGSSFLTGTVGRNSAGFQDGVLGCSDYGTTESDFLNSCYYVQTFWAGGVGGRFIGAGHDSTYGVGVIAIGRGANGVGINASGTTAGSFSGNVVIGGNLNVTGTVTKGGGAFRIDHPLNPAHSYLQHSFVESPDMKDVYDGMVVTDKRGFATVRMPKWFQALNRTFRYQLTIVGTRGWNARVVKPIAGNRFTIQSDRPQVKVSWQVTGIRHDRFANAHRIRTVVPKAKADQGKYLYPQLYGKPASQAIGLHPRSGATRTPKK
jgi:hypothetical protein